MREKHSSLGVAIVRAGVLACTIVGTAHGQPLAPNDNPLALGLDHVTIGVADLDKEIEWYRRVLGLNPGEILHTPRFDAQMMTAPGVRIDLIHQAGSTRPTPLMGFDKQGWLHIALVTTNIEAVEAHLAKTGVPAEVIRDKSGQITVITFKDPEGNAIEIMRK